MSARCGLGGVVEAVEEACCGSRASDNTGVQILTHRAPNPLQPSALSPLCAPLSPVPSASCLNNHPASCLHLTPPCSYFWHSVTPLALPLSI
ncbi:hypothetical protein E2C01_052076 [Portunus trituberculatus]|uniref:Uncharacterized protein n=1 Tax=Portunus trituberculatus TaxID=210409 RepID=A0A5B7GDG5_PORTR|nr:hypothetical protein [Portunus trituberculatus]